MKLALVFVVCLVLLSTQVTLAQFQSSASSLNNTFTAALIFPTLTPGPSGTPTPTTSPTTGPTPTVSLTPTPTPIESGPTPDGGNVISGNGQNSHNSIDVIIHNSTSSTQINNANVSNTVVVNSTTGGNSANGNTVTGNSTVDVNIFNTVNH